MIIIVIVLSLFVIVPVFAFQHGTRTFEGFHSKAEEFAAHGMASADRLDAALAAELAAELRIAREQRAAREAANQAPRPEQSRPASALPTVGLTGAA